MQTVQGFKETVWAIITAVNDNQLLRGHHNWSDLRVVGCAMRSGEAA